MYIIVYFQGVHVQPFQKQQNSVCILTSVFQMRLFFVNTNDDHRDKASFPQQASEASHLPVAALVPPLLKQRLPLALPLTGILSRLSPICWCRTADVIGCSLLLFTDSRRRTWKYMPPLLWIAFFFFFFFFLSGSCARLGSESLRRVRCVAGTMRNCTASRSHEITSSR